jgi:predicted porin
VVGDSGTTWHAVIGAAYRFNPKWSVLAAYRVLSNDIDDGSFKWDVVRSGVGLAVTYSFQ